MKFVAIFAVVLVLVCITQAMPQSTPQYELPESNYVNNAAPADPAQTIADSINRLVQLYARAIRVSRERAQANTQRYLSGVQRFIAAFATALNPPPVNVDAANNNRVE